MLWTDAGTFVPVAILPHSHAPPAYNRGMETLIHDDAMRWLERWPDLIAVQLQIGNPPRMLFDGKDEYTSVSQLDTRPLTAADTLAVVHALFPESQDSRRKALLARRPMAFPQPQHNAIIFISMTDAGFEIWIYRKPAR